MSASSMSAIGARFGRLTVTGDGRPSPRGELTLRCRCDCGSVSDVYPRNLLSGATRSCGCLRAEKCAEVGRASKGTKRPRARAA